MLSPQLLQLLRAWWPEGRRRNLLLPGGHVYSPAAIQLRRCRPASSAALSVPPTGTDDALSWVAHINEQL